MTSDGRLSTRIPLFSSRNNRLVLAHSTRKFRRRTESNQERRARQKIGIRMTNSTQRIIVAFFLRLYIRRNKEDRQEIKMRMIEDPRTKTMTLGEDNVTNKMKLEASWKLFA
ncbi:hypothetical protein ALC57_10918 [Trachymyrmex cornetzi]|uniref:Uncharacterized protein n=1 Tax=Trachymyrmex cornetzi TaxID=471704 RepID=A0A151J394_9HYME|nr:hypothetical protein ALC57_10918 [Trachymyrmex cornetzi]